MVIGIGTDIVEVARIRLACQRSGKRFSERILTEREQAVFTERQESANWLAKRFAAKEAAAKALGTGIGPVSFQDIEVSSNPQGAPLLTLYGAAATLQKQRGITRLHISLTDERAYAQAFVVLEAD